MCATDAIGEQANTMANNGTAYGDGVSPLRFEPLNYAGPDTDYTVSLNDLGYRVLAAVQKWASAHVNSSVQLLAVAPSLCTCLFLAA